MTEHERIALLRRAYTRGRVRDAAPEALSGLGVGAVLLVAGAASLHAVLIGGLLAGALVACGVARTSLLEGARWGLLGAAGPVLSVLMMARGCSSGMGLSCTELCMGLSVLVGLALGAWGGVLAARSGRWTPLAGLLITASIAGSGGCIATGVGHALGLGLALAVAMLPGYAVGRWSTLSLSS